MDQEWYDISKEGWAHQLNLENLDIGDIDENMVYCWFIHPESNEHKAILRWEQFLYHVLNKNVLVFLDAYSVHKNLKERVTALKDNDQLYLGGWMGYSVTEELEQTIKNHQNIILGRRFGYCVKKHFEYLRDRTPLDRITLLKRYSFCCENSNHIRQALEYYKGEGAHIYYGKIDDLLEATRNEH